MKGRDGAALMLVLWLIVVLGAIGTEVVVATRSATAIGANHRARAVARYAAESGVAAAVATLEDNLARVADADARRAYLNRLDLALGPAERLTLGDARAAVALVDVGARIDVNTAGVASLTRLFSFFTDPIAAEGAAAALARALPLRSLDEMSGIPALPGEVARRAAEFLTVDGDGRINRVSASDTVLAAAGGELRDEPSRILVVSRGWQEGHPLTHEIEALYALVGDRLTLVRWRERDR